MADHPLWRATADAGAGAHSRAGRLSTKAPIRHLDVSLIPIILLLTAAGCVAVRSASARLLQVQGEDPNLFLKRQLIFVALASMAFVVALLFDYRQIRDYAPIIYGVSVVLLVAVFTPFGVESSGAKRWINLGFLQLQPSELMKVALIAALAAMLAKEGAFKGPESMILSLGVMAVPAALVYVQPDIGTSMVFFAIVIAVLLVAGMPIRWLAILFISLVLVVGGAIKAGVLKEYQVSRLTAFLDSQTDTQRAGFNLAQSKIAIGSGGISGKGLGNGSQTNLAYVPEQHTDFIFTAIGEEQGFLGSLSILGLFSLLLWRSLRIAMVSKDKFGTLLAVGIAAMFAFQFFVNLGMTVGILPITGIPLPFVSYGGSSLITSFFAVGLLMNIHMRRFV